MLPWIQVYSNLAEHPKIYALVDRMGLRRNYEAVGIVVSLWLWAAKNAPNGDLSGFPVRAIAAGVGVSGKNEKVLCPALVDSGWLDPAPNGGYEIHDWLEYAPAIVDMFNRDKEKNRERARRYRERKKESEAAAMQTDHGENHVTHHVTMQENNAPREEKIREEKIREDKTREDERRVDERREDGRREDKTREDEGRLGEDWEGEGRIEKDRENTGEDGESKGKDREGEGDARPQSWTKAALFRLFLPRMYLNDAALEELMELSRGMEAAVLRHALDIAQENGRMGWDYVKGIVKNWRQQGICTLDQLERGQRRQREGRITAAKSSLARPTTEQQSNAAARELAAAIQNSRAGMKRLLEEK